MAAAPIRLTVPALKPRNPHALGARRRKGGRHARSSGAVRQQARRDLRQALAEPGHTGS
jgi:hypothetical protein